MIMKNIVRICMVIFTCLLFTGCYDRDVVGSKWKIQCKLPPKTKRFCPLVLK